MLIKLQEGFYVAFDQIAEVKINERIYGITVRMKDGVDHHVDCDSGRSAFETVDRLVKEINFTARSSQ
jgi:hypothetical protein